MGVEAEPAEPGLCGGCEISRIDEEQQALALETGRAIFNTPELSSQYGRVLLRLAVSGSITHPQSTALVSCIKNNRDNKCQGLSRPDGIYAVQ